MALKQAGIPAKLSFYVRARERGKPDNLDRLIIDEGSCRVTEGPQGWTVRGFATQETIEALQRDLDYRNQQLVAMTAENNELSVELDIRRSEWWSGLIWGTVATAALFGVLRWVGAI